MILDKILIERKKIESLMTEMTNLNPNEEHRGHALADLIIRHKEHHKELTRLLIPLINKKGELIFSDGIVVGPDLIFEAYGTPKEAYLN